jgi:uncharacterized delta-60 repeat protein
MKMKNRFFTIALVFSAMTVFAQTTDVNDSKSGKTGIVTTSLSATNDEVMAMAIQKDGKIVLAGCSNTNFALIRYQQDGTLDESFGKGGIVTTSLSGGDDCSTAIAIQDDGKILASGTSHNGTSKDFALLRYNANGSLDASFGKEGIVINSIQTGDDNASGIAIQKDGKIVVAGSSNNGNSNDFALIRYNPNGTLDKSFGKKGIIVTSLQTGNDDVAGFTLQPDGKILVSGSSNNGKSNDFALARYNVNGTMDPDFGTGGVVMTSLGNGNDDGSGIALQKDGKIIVSGSSDNGTSKDFAMVRYNANGKPDASFGKNGIVMNSVQAGDDKASKLTILKDGKILIFGTSNNGKSNDFALARYNVNGTLDPAFGKGGLVITSLGAGDETGSEFAIQKDGKIVVAGTTFNGSSTDFALIRYNANGTLDASFAAGKK